VLPQPALVAAGRGPTEKRVPATTPTAYTAGRDVVKLGTIDRWISEGRGCADPSHLIPGSLRILPDTVSSRKCA
jgi:hypothetical protein